MNGDEYKDSQQEPNQDSALQTPQPDQPHPPMGPRFQDGPEDSQPVEVNADIPAAPAEQTESD